MEVTKTCLISRFDYFYSRSSSSKTIGSSIDLQIIGNKISLTNRSTITKLEAPPSKLTNVRNTFIQIPAKTTNRNKIHTVIKQKSSSIKPNSGGVYRASVRDKKPTNSAKKLTPTRTPILEKYSPTTTRKILQINKISYPNTMTNFDPEIHNEIVNDKETTGNTLSSYNENQSNTSLNHNRSDIDVTSMAYLRNTYSHLHENQFVKLNKLLSDTENEQLKLKRKQRINLRKGLYNDKSIETEDDTYASEGSFSSENSSENNEITEITKDMSNIELNIDSKSPAKPIITFTPVRSGDEDLDQHYHSTMVVERPPSSGSSSPLLEVPITEFGDISTEMMRPPING